jgi:ubiquinone/menaquinone biosynthesis C-methylase UbiE
MSSASHYVLGHSDAELERLQLQARCLEGLTRRLIRECGIERGMRVLDLGCGAGDVALLVAEAVGPSGAVVGVDREQRAVALSRRRAAEAGYDHVAFATADDEGLSEYEPFDAAVGRFVLIHQKDPAATVRRVADAVRPGGIVAFLEPADHVDGHTLPEIELARAARQSLFNFIRAALPSHDVAGRMIPCFIDAGLPEPRVLWESIVSGSDDIYLRWFISSYKTLLPLMERLGTVDPRVGDPETLYERILEAARATRAQSVTEPYASAWAIKPSAGPRLGRGSD